MSMAAPGYDLTGDVEIVNGGAIIASVDG